MTTPEDQHAVAAYCAGYLAGIMSHRGMEFSKVMPTTDDAGVVTGELQFNFAGWECSLGIEAHKVLRHES